MILHQVRVKLAVEAVKKLALIVMISQNYLFHFIWGVSNGEDLKIYKMVKILTNHTILEPGGHEIP